MGICANVNFEYRQFILGIGYEQGLRNIADKDNRQNLDYKNNSFQFSIAYNLCNR